MNEIQSTEIKQIEIEINFYKNQTVQSIFEIGERLIKAKNLVEHGEWEDWLENKIDFSKPQAQRFMQVAREFPNAVSLRGLNQSKVFALVALPQEEREEFIKTNPVEDMTTRELRQVIKENKELESKLEELENKEPTVVEKEVEVEPKDYHYYKTTTARLQEKITRLDRSLEDKELELEKATDEKNILERKAQLNERESKKYRELKEQIGNLTKQSNDLSREIRAKTELSGLTVKIEHMLKTELAPIKYSRAIKEACTDEIVRRNLNEIIDRVQEWTDEMRSYTNTNIIEVEGFKQ